MRLRLSCREFVNEFFFHISPLFIGFLFASEEFGNSIMSEVLPYLINKDDGRINRATTASKGELCSSFSYLENFIRTSGS